MFKYVKIPSIHCISLPNYARKNKNKLRWCPQQPRRCILIIYTNLSEACCEPKRWKPSAEPVEPDLALHQSLPDLHRNPRNMTRRLHQSTPELFWAEDPVSLRCCGKTGKKTVKTLNISQLLGPPIGFSEYHGPTMALPIAFARRFSAMACCFSSREGHSARLGAIPDNGRNRFKSCL